MPGVKGGGKGSRVTGHCSHPDFAQATPFITPMTALTLSSPPLTQRFGNNGVADLLSSFGIVGDERDQVFGTDKIAMDAISKEANGHFLQRNTPIVNYAIGYPYRSPAPGTSCHPQRAVWSVVTVGSSGQLESRKYGCLLHERNELSAPL